MVTLHIDDRALTIEPRGLHKLWTLRRRIVVPLASIREVRRAPPGTAAGLWKGWRLPGTHLPGVIIAGSFYKSGERTFWDVRGDGRNAIELKLSGTSYDRIIVDVEDRSSALERLRFARAEDPSQEG